MAICSCASKAARRACQLGLESRRQITTKDVISARSARSIAALRVVGCHCKNLEEVSVRLPPQGWCSNLILDAMGDFARNASSLVKLSLVNVDVDDASICRLAETARKLKSIELGSTEHSLPNYTIKDKGLCSIAKFCVEIESVTLHRCCLCGNEAVAALGKYKRKLHTLRLYACPEVTEDGLIEVAEGCNDIKTLDLISGRNLATGALIDGDVAAAFGHCTKDLQELRLCEEALGAALIDDACLAPLFIGCRKLKIVELHGVDITDDVLILIAANCVHLRTLILENTWVTNKGVESLSAKCANLENLTINGCWVRTTTPLSPVASLLNSSMVFPPILNTISSACTGLRSLDLSDLAVNPVAAFIALSNAPFLSVLECLSLSWSGVYEPVGVDGTLDEVLCNVLAKCPRLMGLRMEAYPGDIDKVLQACLPATDRLALLELPWTNVTDLGLDAVSHSKSPLKFLDIACCNLLTENALHRICVNKGSSLKELNMYDIEAVSDAVVEQVLGSCLYINYVNLGSGPKGSKTTQSSLKKIRSAMDVRHFQVDFLPNKRKRTRISDKLNAV